MGSLVGGLLSHAGYPVTLVDIRMDIIERVRRDGVKIITEDGVLVAKPLVDTPETVNRVFNAVIVLVKSYATRNAADTASRILAPWGIAVSLQNGLGNLEVLKEVLGDRAHGGAATWGATLESPGVVRLGGRGAIYLQKANPGYEKAHEYLYNALERAGLNPVIVDDIDRIIWLKLIVNTVINPITAVLGKENIVVYRNRWIRKLAPKIIEEAWKIASRQGIKLPPPEELLDTVMNVAETTGANRSSMLQDIESCRRTEADAILGELINRGRRAGIEVPVVETLYTLVKALEEECSKD
ncbi:MAG: ketopantoate reductase family protein [Desulfurococcales archaeon]|nr:ketopantoate reductase family protein [Desulfurococcales archaeon]